MDHNQCLSNSTANQGKFLKFMKFVTIVGDNWWQIEKEKGNQLVQLQLKSKRDLIIGFRKKTTIEQVTDRLDEII